VLLVKKKKVNPTFLNPKGKKKTAAEMKWVIKQTDRLTIGYINLQTMKQVRKGNLLKWKTMDAKSSFLMEFHARMDYGNGDDTLGSANTSLPRFSVAGMVSLLKLKMDYFILIPE